jgi:hypothetical protein
MAPTRKPDSNPPFRAVAAADEVLLALDCQELLDATGPLPTLGVVHRRFADLGPALLAELRPGRIIMPLFAAGYDAMAAVEILEQLGFGGQISVIAPDLPRPRLVERELRALGPGLRLSLITPGVA